MFNAFAHNVRNRINNKVLDEDTGYSLVELIVVMAVLTIIATFGMPFMFTQIRLTEESAEQHRGIQNAGIVSVLVTDAVRSSAGVARIDPTGTSVSLREADGSCTQISLVGTELRERNFTLTSAAHENVISEKVLMSATTVQEGKPVFSQLDLGVQVAVTIGADATTEREEKTVDSNFAALVDAPVATPDTQCTYVPFS